MPGGWPHPRRLTGAGGERYIERWSDFRERLYGLRLAWVSTASALIRLVLYFKAAQAQDLFLEVKGDPPAPIFDAVFADVPRDRRASRSPPAESDRAFLAAPRRAAPDHPRHAGGAIHLYYALVSSSPRAAHLRARARVGGCCRRPPRGRQLQNSHRSECAPACDAEGCD
jgi:hypothetical protein